MGGIVGNSRSLDYSSIVEIKWKKDEMTTLGPFKEVARHEALDYRSLFAENVLDEINCFQPGSGR